MNDTYSPKPLLIAEKPIGQIIRVAAAAAGGLLGAGLLGPGRLLGGGLGGSRSRLRRRGRTRGGRPGRGGGRCRVVLAT